MYNRKIHMKKSNKLNNKKSNKRRNTNSPKNVTKKFKILTTIIQASNKHISKRNKESSNNVGD